MILDNSPAIIHLHVHGDGPDTIGTLREDEVDPLAAAAAYLRRVAGTTGEESFELRAAAAVSQRDALIFWAGERGLILDPGEFGGVPVTGGAEHDVWTEGADYWKITRPDHFGWTVLPGEDGKPYQAYATPLEYLERWLLARKHLGDAPRLRGIVVADGSVSVVISHPAVEGSESTAEAIAETLVSAGFVPIPGFVLGAQENSSYYHVGWRLGVFDASGDNFITSPWGLVAVDIVLLEASEVLHRQIVSLMNVSE